MKTAPDLIRDMYATGAYFVRVDVTGFDIRGRTNRPPPILDEIDDNIHNVMLLLIGDYYAVSSLDWCH